MKSKKMIISGFFKWMWGDKCEFCNGSLRKNKDLYYGGVEVQDSIGGIGKKRTAYLCNLCYQLFKAVKAI